MTNARISVLSAAILAASVGATQAATTLYSETFAGQNGKGAFFGATDTTGVTWSIDAGDAQLFANDDIFGVVGEEFVIQDTNAGCPDSSCNSSLPPVSTVDLPIWRSPLIDVAGFSNLSVTADLDFGSASFENTGGVRLEDDFFIDLLLDGASVFLTDFVTATGTITATSFGQTVGAGSTLQIAITGNTTAGTERIAFDNVTVTGEVPVVPLPAGILLLLTGTGALLVARRRHTA